MTFFRNAPFSFEDRCNPLGQGKQGEILLDSNTAGDDTDPGETSAWEFTTPGFASLQSLSMSLNFPGTWKTNGDLEWFASAEAADGSIHTVEHSRRPELTASASYTLGAAYGNNTIVAGTKRFSNQIICNPFNFGDIECQETPNVRAITRSLRVVLSENTLPTMDRFSGSVFKSPARGTESAVVRGKDIGSSGVGSSGVAFSNLVIDGSEPNAALISSEPSEDLSCREPYHIVRPCPEQEVFEHTFDTTQLHDGPHTLRFEVCDATRTNCAVSGEPPILIDNAPRNLVPPGISGNAKIGSSLLANPGAWEGPSGSSFGLQTEWFRCPSPATSVAQCQNLNVSGSNYTLGEADGGKSLRVRVTATINADGRATASAVSAPFDIAAAPTQPGGGPTQPGGGPTQRKAPPETILTRAPKKRSAARAKFAFKSDQTGVGFECRFDKGTFRACSSPLRKKFKPGRHKLRVRAVGPDGLRDPTPATVAWTVVPR